MFYAISHGMFENCIGQILLRKNFMRVEQLAEVIAAQKSINMVSERKFKLGEICLFQKLISLSQLHEALRTQGPNYKPAIDNNDVHWITNTKFVDKKPLK